MMRLFTFLFIFCYQTSAYAQVPVESNHLAGDYARQIGVDVTEFLSQIFSFSGGSSFNNPTYFLHYKNRKNEKVNRMGVGLAFQIDGEGEGTDSDISLFFRAGRERQINFAKRWRFSYGGDFKTNFSFRNLGTTDVSQLNLAVGGAPILGIEFFVNPRLSLATEAAYNCFLVVKNQDGETSFGGVGAMQLPQSIIMHFAF